MHRTSGVVLHPLSLPTHDLGASVDEFLDFLQRAQQGLWQVLPLNPTGYGHSPYQTLSAFAGNPLLVSEVPLVQAGWLPTAPPDPPSTGVIDYDRLIQTRLPRLQQAFYGFRARAHAHHWEEFQTFCVDHGDWLDDYALFSALKRRFYGEPWWKWPADLAHRRPDALRAARETLDEFIGIEQFTQFQFFQQWQRVREAAHRRGIRIIGDMPLFVAHDSAEVWAQRSLFLLDDYGQPTAVAGVPPDYFSEQGQIWGNPLYDWAYLAQDNYRFWVERLRLLLSQCDFVRIDHFRGLAAYWSIAPKALTAKTGHWEPGPGLDLFRVLAAELGDLPLIAEDLGLITEDVVALRDALALPGMAVLQFAFMGNQQGRLDSLYLPHFHQRHQVVYTGTHDNDTAQGWWQQQPETTRHLVRRYLNTDGKAIHWDLIRTALGSVADFALFPAQDGLGLPTSARMNRPGSTEGNWAWALSAGALDEPLADSLAELAHLFNRQSFSQEF